MGYDVHITRAEEWINSETTPITAEEWETYLTSHPEIRSKEWFSYSDGAVHTKNPDEEILRKMYQIAKHFGAHVQGDEGEGYDESGQSNWQPPPDVRIVQPVPWYKRMVHWFQDRKNSRELESALGPVLFKVGDRVRDEVSGRFGKVMKIDPMAQHGLGIVRVRCDDGEEIQRALHACGFEPVFDREKKGS